MADGNEAAVASASEDGKPPDYDAFLSYAHRDRQVTNAIQKGLHQIGGTSANCGRCGCFGMTRI
ncbi:MAG: hypothetical protein QOJ56_554 [Mycobacterium sp.]|jgi:hypothetical protein|nr:hypothetical protein [Mycobacterium sp.]